MTYKKGLVLSSLMAALLTMSGCGSDSDSDNDQDAGAGAGESTTRTVSVDFRAMVGDEEMACSENNQTKLYNGVGTTNETIGFTDFRFFVSEIHMVKADGTKVPLTLTNNEYQYQADNGDHTALLDFEDASGDCKDRGNTADTYTTVVGTVPEGEYTDLEFTLGVPFDINHDKDSYVDVQVLNQPKMNWSWQAGRKFTKIEAKPQSDQSLVWNFHLGSTGCSANEDTTSNIVTSDCVQPNRVQVALKDFDPQTNFVKVDYQALVANNDLSQDLGASKGCMSSLVDPECNAIMSALALDMANETGKCINNEDCSSQTFFKAASK